MACTASLVLLSYYCYWPPQKSTFEEQALVAGTKQTCQADKADGLTSEAGWQGWKAHRY
jgi:hypothetical protein